MRQTSQAVVLLLSTASAADAAVAWADATEAVAATPTFITQGQAVNGNVKNPIYQIGFNQATAAKYKINVAKDNTWGGTAGQVAGTTSCVDCVRGNTAAAGKWNSVKSVWCSAAWNYEFKTGAAYKENAANTPVAFNKDGTSDAGACCYDPVEFNKALIVAEGTDSTVESQQLLNKWTCPARFSNSWAAAGAATKKWTSVTKVTTAWWCSDGLYNLAASADHGTLGATASGNGNDNSLNSAAGGGYKPAILPDGTQDRRLELFLAHCRQKFDICGSSFVDPTTAGSAMARTPTKSGTGWSSSEKCTWTLASSTKAPTFRIQHASDTGANMLTDKMDIIYQEWIGGWQLVKNVDFVESLKATSTVTTMSGVPFGHMLGAQYAKAAKWNYFNTDNADWAAQTRGQAWYYTQQDRGAAACAVATDTDYTAGTESDCFDKTAGAKATQRWISSVDAASGALTAAQAAVTRYNGLAGTFNTAAASYNKYLADLKTANEKDAFAAFFSPPAKPAFVKRPGAPTAPAAWTGLQHWPTASQQEFWDKKGSGVPALGTHFILGNRGISDTSPAGGWGAWTIQRLVGGYKKGKAYPLWHSFGLLGVQQSATQADNLSWVKAWQQGSEKAADMDTLVKIAGTHATKGFVTCGNSADQTTTSWACPFKDDAKPGTKIAASAGKAYLVVSLWTNDATELTAANNVLDATIQFYAQNWAADGYYAPAAGTALTTLSEPAAAQALAATAAAALAVAAALY